MITFLSFHGKYLAINLSVIKVSFAHSRTYLVAIDSSGGASSEILVRHKGGIFFWDGFYCIFGQFEVMTPISKSEKLGRLEPHGPHC